MEKIIVPEIFESQQKDRKQEAGAKARMKAEG
jgi:hypothetical protein